MRAMQKKVKKVIKLSGYFEHFREVVLCVFLTSFFYTGRIHLVGDTEICLHIQETNRGDIRLTTCHCDAGISQAPAFGRRLPEEL